MVFAIAIPASADYDYAANANIVYSSFEGKTVILHSNDVHGALAGYAYMPALKAQFEAAGAEVYMVDAGDFSQGTVYVSSSLFTPADEPWRAGESSDLPDEFYARLLRLHSELQGLPLYEEVPLSSLPEPGGPSHSCEECGQMISPAFSMSVTQLAAYTRKKYGKALCAECAKAKKEEQKDG